MALCVVNHGKLTRSDALHIVFALNHPFTIVKMREFSLGEDWSVAILEHDFHRPGGFSPRIARNEVHFVEVEHLAILLGCAIAVAHIHHIILHILLHHYAEMPIKTVLEVTYTEPGVKGDTATNTLKPATVESGAEVRVPLFINVGEKIEIDTRDGSYVGRVR